ncbi:hypothetical protein ABI59_03940 [Acidobacteria bacterium Mor1]|nr:hypothetical protein ABI59_03940 [Acidobacteria bacterium Mor1]
MRLFIAIELPASARRELERRVAELRGRRGWRFVPSRNLHLTLRFLGEVSAAQRRPLFSACAAAVSSLPGGRLGLSDLGVFPGPRRPRVLWCGLRQEPADWLLPLAREVERAVRSAGFPAEDRPFRPHVTLARAVRGQRPAVPPDAAGGAGAEGRERFRVSRVVLFRSHLGAAGARYEALEQWPLAGMDAPGPQAG